VTSPAAIRVREATPQDLVLWQQFVDRRADAGGMHHAAWYSVLRDAYWVTPHFLMAADPEGNVSGILSLYHSRSPLTGSYLSSLEDGVLAARPEAVGALLSEARSLRDRLGARYLQIRGGAIDEPASITVPTVRTFISTGTPADQLWSAIKKKTRWAIRQAEKHDIVVEQDPELQGLEAFYRVYAAHLRALGTPVPGLDAFQSLRHRFGAHRLRLYLVRHQDALIGGMLCIVNAARWTDYYAVARPIGATPFANYLLYWHVIRDASHCGVPHFDMGRSTPQSNVHLFKRKWGGSDVSVPYHFYPTPGRHAGDMGLQALKTGRKIPQRIWSKLPLSVCNRLGPLLRKQLPFI
jgi:FemAB-related protein (PEP-CTERM system-associated)